MSYELFGLFLTEISFSPETSNLHNITILFPTHLHYEGAKHELILTVHQQQQD